MGKIKIIFSLIALALFYFCVDTRVRIIHVPDCGTVIPPFDSLATEALKGDTLAYFEMEWIYSLNDFDLGSVSLYNFLMCHKYNYLDGYSYTYEIMDRRAEYTGIQPNEESVSMALNNLKRGLEMQNALCGCYLGRVYIQGKYVDRDTILAREYMVKACGDSSIGKEVYKEEMMMWEKSHKTDTVNIKKQER